MTQSGCWISIDHILLVGKKQVGRVGRELVGEEDTEYSPFSEILSTYITTFLLTSAFFGYLAVRKLGNVVFHPANVPSLFGFYY